MELVVKATTKDGELNAFSTSYAAAHGAANANTLLDGTIWAYLGDRNYQTGSNPDVFSFQIYRFGMFFDTSALPSGVTVTAVVLSLYGQTDQATNEFDMVIVSGDDLTYNQLVVADYGDLLNEITSLGELNTASFVTGAFNEITFNAAGRDKINVGGITKLAIRSSRDISSSQPAQSEANRVQFYQSHLSFQDFAPKLTITYTTLFPSSSNTAIRVTGIRRIYRPGIYRMMLSLGEVSDMDDIAGRRDYENYRHWWSFEPTMPPPSEPPPPVGDDPERQWLFPTRSNIPESVRQTDSVSTPPPDRIPRTGRGAVPYAGDDPERQPLRRSSRTKLPFPAPPPSFEPKIILEAPKIFIRSIVNFVRSFWSDW